MSNTIYIYIYTYQDGPKGSHCDFWNWHLQGLPSPALRSWQVLRMSWSGWWFQTFGSFSIWIHRVYYIHVFFHNIWLIWSIYDDKYYILVGGLEHNWIIFPYIGKNHPKRLSYFSEGLKPPTRNLVVLFLKSSSHFWRVTRSLSLISSFQSFISGWLVVSNIFYFPRYWEQSSQLTFIFFKIVF